MRLSAGVGRICAPVSLIVPGYLVVVMGGWGALARVFPAALLCGVTFAGLQFTISNFVGPQLTDLIASLCALGVLVVLFMVWKPSDHQKYEDQSPPPAPGAEEARGTFHRTSDPGLEPVPFVGRLCLAVGLAAHDQAVEFAEHSRFVAGFAQSDLPRSSGHR